MVPARGHIGDDFAVAIEPRHNHGYVGQVRSAVIWRVENIDIAGPNAAPVAAVPACGDDGPDRIAHRSEMHRNMRRIGDQRAVAIEQRTGKIQPLLDVHRSCGVLQRNSHLLGNRHEGVVENFELNRIDRAARREPVRQIADPFQNQISQRIDPGPPARFNDRRRVALANDRRARQ